ncbi:hypothetical protein L798_00195 [Zootermopsis nevadensis]|uniref:Uncharacterized protein n=1 Tax=Zootermopsis nevadensis TaxID=136037 RepID=A0A067QP87_ZOONE|nr:hypothetical protein L798_00195 [Zootermopsis nevadensis]
MLKHEPIGKRNKGRPLKRFLDDHPARLVADLQLYQQISGSVRARRENSPETADVEDRRRHL